MTSSVRVANTGNISKVYLLEFKRYFDFCKNFNQWNGITFVKCTRILNEFKKLKKALYCSLLNSEQN